MRRLAGVPGSSLNRFTMNTPPLSKAYAPHVSHLRSSAWVSQIGAHKHELHGLCRGAHDGSTTAFGQC